MHTLCKRQCKFVRWCPFAVCLSTAILFFFFLPQSNASTNFNILEKHLWQGSDRAEDQRGDVEVAEGRDEGDCESRSQKLFRFKHSLLSLWPPVSHDFPLGEPISALQNGIKVLGGVMGYHGRTGTPALDHASSAGVLRDGSRPVGLWWLQRLQLTASIRHGSRSGYPGLIVACAINQVSSLFPAGQWYE